MKNKKLKISIAILSIIIIVLGITLVSIKKNTKTELLSIKTEKQLQKIYDRDYYDKDSILTRILTLPFSLAYLDTYGVYEGNDAITMETNRGDIISSSPALDTAATSGNTTGTKDYSTTNIQVENVDEADIIKTDGDYIYSISGYNVVITEVKEAQNPKIISKIAVTEGAPEDMILQGNTLVVILKSDTGNNTIVNIYDITNKEKIETLKTYTMYEPYYTSRCIEDKLYVISSGRLRKEKDNIVRYYEEDDETKEISLTDIKYLTDIQTNKQTLISYVNLSKPTEEAKINSYLIDVSNAYVSEKYIYLLNEDYQSSGDVPPISTLFGLYGIYGPFKWEEESDRNYGYYTDIYKFAIKDNGEIEYNTKTKVEGKTINQYSIDEYEGNLRIAVQDTSKGSRIIVLDKNLKEIGATEYLAKGEKMYSSRFMANKAYLVTYKTVDPLFVIDLSKPEAPKVLGKLKIPGYSTYLHPYDENHLIGIGMQTEEIVNRNTSGKITSTTSRITGMKMALFDVSDVTRPKEISNVVIGDSYTTSAILTNPKALLFSKEKGIIAIPINKYKEKFEVNTGTSYESEISNYTNNSKSYISEGYFVCSINAEEGFKIKGTITHEKEEKENSNRTSSYRYISKLLRGLYIEDNLYTVSEEQIKVNDINTLEEKSNIKIK